MRLSKNGAAVFLGFGFVSAQSQAAAGMLLRQSLAKTPKILAPHGYSISSNALIFEISVKGLSILPVFVSFFALNFQPSTIN